MKKLILALAAVAAIVSEASAGGGCTGPWCQGKSHSPYGQPQFQAAPWYLYWPYNAHFQTASPMMGAYYAPPTHGGMIQSPYFPAQGYNR